MVDQTIPAAAPHDALPDESAQAQPLEGIGRAVPEPVAAMVARLILSGAPTGLCDQHGCELAEGDHVRLTGAGENLMITYDYEVGFAASIIGTDYSTRYPLSPMERVGHGKKRRWLKGIERMGN